MANSINIVLNYIPYKNRHNTPNHIFIPTSIGQLLLCIINVAMFGTNERFKGMVQLRQNVFATDQEMTGII